MLELCEIPHDHYSQFAIPAARIRTRHFRLSRMEAKTINDSQ